MSHAFSNDLRHRLVSAVEDGMTRRSAAKRFGVSPTTATKWLDQWFQEGHIDPARQGHQPVHRCRVPELLLCCQSWPGVIGKCTGSRSFM